MMSPAAVAGPIEFSSSCRATCAVTTQLDAEDGLVAQRVVLAAEAPARPR